MARPVARILCGVALTTTLVAFTVLMNHELGGSSGVVRAHGARGAFVSKWTIRLPPSSTWIFLDGEEVAGGRAFAHLLNGTSYELPWIGKASWENILANPGTGDKTVVAGLDDTTPGRFTSTRAIRSPPEGPSSVPD
jgi:hypothetical protein